MKKFTLLACVLIVISILCSNISFAEEKEVVLVGKVDVKYDDDMEKVLNIEFKSNGQTYYIKLDDKGKQIASDHDWENLEITGKLNEEDGKKTITVSKFKVVEEEKDKEENDKEENVDEE